SAQRPLMMHYDLQKNTPISFKHSRTTTELYHEPSQSYSNTYFPVSLSLSLLHTHTTHTHSTHTHTHTHTHTQTHRHTDTQTRWPEVHCYDPALEPQQMKSQTTELYKNTIYSYIT